MGFYTAIVDDLNDKSREIARVQTRASKRKTSWRKTADAIGLDLDDRAATLIDAWPEELKATLVALVGSAMSTGARLRWLWKPGYDFEVTVSKTNFDDHPEYTVVLSSPYPATVLEQ